jgi:uncharacterized protein YbbK (DUF523 family)
VADLPRVLVSSCLLGQPVRYDGTGAPSQHPILQRWVAEGRVVPLCPEGLGGLPTPRPPAEIRGGGGGEAVLRGEAPVLAITGADVTPAFLQGAREAAALAQVLGIRVAVLKDGSPSCGSGYTYDGSFGHVRVAVPGVTAVCLQAIGIKVFNETQWEEADSWVGPSPSGGAS